MNSLRSTKGMLVLAVALVAGAWRVASAGDDGGGRSVFAVGAGNRALALGGAYTALANDASAPLWNPAGLGLVQRRELEVTRTNYYGLGINEQYASFVMPDWRWGTASVTFRHFGVGGIEERDDRNVLLNDDLSDNEVEFSIGYGRKLNANLCVGSVVKLQHQSLAGFGDTGIGLDFGVVARPLAILYPNNPTMRRLSTGLFVRNAVEPLVRLSQDRVSDPTGARLGFAYELPTWGGRPLTLAMDVERTRGMNTHLHTGLELAVHPFLRLRGGIGNGSFTAGSGTSWRGVAVNYTFESNHFDQIHRVGASFSFGLSVDEQRIAEREREENEMQSRLARLYEQRRDEKLQQLLAQADRAGRNEDFQEAIRILEVVNTLEPGHVEANRRKTRYLCDLGHQFEENGDFADAALAFSRALAVEPDNEEASDGARRCRALGDELAERSIVIRRHFSEALDAFSRNDLVAAREGFRTTLELAPEDREAAAMLDRTVNAIDLHVTDLVNQANRMIEWKQFDEATRALARAKNLSPDAPELEALGRRLAAARASSSDGLTANISSASNESGPAAGAKPLTEDQKREVEYLYKHAMKAMSENRIDEAVRYWELVWSIAPGYERVAEHLKGEYLRRGMEFFADGDLDKAVDIWEQALRIDPNDERTKGYLSRAREQKARAREIFGGKG